MPITIQASEGLYKKETEPELVVALTDLILNINGASKNPLARKHLIVSFAPFGTGRSYADGKPVDYVNVTLRIPTFSLDTHEKREEFVEKMSEILVEKAEGRLQKDRVYINMIYGDGVWGVEGKAYTDGELLATMLEAGRNM